MACKHCVTETEEGKDPFTYCPIDCLPLRGKWQRLVYSCIQGTGISQSGIILKLKKETDQDVRQQYVQRAMSSLLKNNHIQKNGNKNGAAVLYVTAIDAASADNNDYSQCDVEIFDAPELSTKELRQFITYHLLSIPQDTTYKGGTPNAPDIHAHTSRRITIERKFITRFVCDLLKNFFPSTYDANNDLTTLFLMAEPSVIRARRLLTNWKKEQDHDLGIHCVTEGRGPYSGYYGFHKVYLEKLWKKWEYHHEILPRVRATIAAESS